MSHNTRTLKLVILGFKAKSRVSQINRKPEQIKSLDIQCMVRLILVEQRNKCVLNTACCFILTHYFCGNFDLHKGIANLKKHHRLTLSH